MKKGYRSWYSVFLNILLMAAVVLMLSGCPSGGDDAADEEGGGGGGNTAVITLLSDGVTMPADGKSSVAIGATLQDSAGEVVAKGTTVTFVTTLGTFANGETTYEAKTLDDTGVVIAALKAGLVQGTAEVTVTSNGVSQAISIELTGEGGAAAPSSLSLATDKTAVQANNSDSATITATVLDANKAWVQGTTVVFSADGGSISSSSAATDANGQAEIVFRSVSDDPSNRTVTITAEAADLSTLIPIRIVGSTITLATGKASIADDGSDEATLTVTAKNAAGVPVYNVPLTFSVSGTGDAELQEFSTVDYTYTLDDATAPRYTGRTDTQGQFKVYVSGTAAGTVTVTVTGLGDVKTQNYTVNPAAAVTFGIDHLESPVGTVVDFADPYALSTNQDLKIVVNAPDAGETEVVFATTVGEWEGVADQMVYNAPIAGGQAEATLRSGLAGLASIQISYGTDTATTDFISVAVSAPSSEASSIRLQPSATVVAPSTGGVTNSVTLEATVKNATEQPVGGAPVAFSIENARGGGESISPVIVYTNSSGVAETTFTSGSLATDTSGVTVTARVVGTAIADSESIRIGGEAGSVSVGRGTVVESVYDDTVYELPMAVLVADSSGNPVSGAVVTLSAWPVSYATGGWYDEDPDPESDRYVVYYSGSYSNEDLNMNLVNDPGEDVNMDGFLTPPNSSAGALPPPVTTDVNGVANFDLVYLKANAAWVTVRITAYTQALGTETTSHIDFTLPVERQEARDGDLPDSNWPAWTTAAAGGTAKYIMPIFREYGTDIYGSTAADGGYFGGPFDPLAPSDDYRTYSFDIPGGTLSGAEFTDTIGIRDELSLMGIYVPIRIIAE